jgi:hypothetical protein
MYEWSLTKSTYTNSGTIIRRNTHPQWEGADTGPAGEYTFFCGMGNENRELGTVFLCIRESCQQLRGLSLLVIECHT